MTRESLHNLSVYTDETGVFLFIVNRKCEIENEKKKVDFEKRYIYKKKYFR